MLFMEESKQVLLVAGERGILLQTVVQRLPSVALPSSRPHHQLYPTYPASKKGKRWEETQVLL